jgi:ADP-dependent NAD(P)H-hydrate dehydratase / NAD(P)H-hydrate epimerase
MLVNTTEHLRAADAYTIQHEPIASLDLMERAAKVCANWIAENFPEGKRFVVFCGPGNNGGDGLAIARLLFEKGISVEVYYSGDSFSADFSENLNRIKTMNIPHLKISDPGNDFPVPTPNEIAIDCIFGSGLNRSVSGFYADLILQINKHFREIISVDIPSGLGGESLEPGPQDPIIKASHTLALQCPRLAMLLPETGNFCGKLVVLDIGLNRGFLNQENTRMHYTDFLLASSLYRPREKFSHKGSFGHALIMAGSREMPGAALLAVRACLHSGPGLVTAGIPSALEGSMEVKNPEAVLKILGGDFIEEVPATGRFQAVGMGPGLGVNESTGKVLKLLIQEGHPGMVLDADALNLLAENPTWLGFLPPETILTPHPGEFKRLFGTWNSPAEKLEVLRRRSATLGCIIVLKGANTCIALPDGSLYFNSSGNPGLAKGGSGDVLLGIITGLRAQGYTAPKAAIFGVYLHGLAADLLLSDSAPESLTADMVIDSLGAAFRFIHRGGK